jgi:hypothetical protein
MHVHGHHWVPTGLPVFSVFFVAEIAITPGHAPLTVGPHAWPCALIDLESLSERAVAAVCLASARCISVHDVLHFAKASQYRYEFGIRQVCTANPAICEQSLTSGRSFAEHVELGDIQLMQPAPQLAVQCCQNAAALLSCRVHTGKPSATNDSPLSSPWLGKAWPAHHRS